MRRYVKRISVPGPVSGRGNRDSSLALINVVFLLLVFLLVAGTLRPPLPPDFQWTETEDESTNGSAEGDLAIDSAGRIWQAGRALSQEELLAAAGRAAADAKVVKVFVDKRARVEHVAGLSTLLGDAGVPSMSLILVEASRQ